MSKRIVLGSGKLYVSAYNKDSGIPEDAVIETDENLLGYISGGATLTYTPEFYEAKDDLGYVSKSYLTKEDVVFTSGILTWNADTLDKLTATGRVSSDASQKTVKIGGFGNYDGKLYVIHFIHEDSEDGAIRITIVGNNQAGFEMQFQKDSETVINAEFKAAPLDNEGTLVIYKEDIK